MSDGLFAPLPLRREQRDPGKEDLARRLIAAEIPDCECPSTLLCLAGTDPTGERYPFECPGVDACGKCPPKPDHACPHVLWFRAEYEAGELPHLPGLDDWRGMLERYDPDGYAEPPPPPQPRIAVTQEARVGLYHLRARAGFALRHPRDVTASARPGASGVEVDQVSVQAGKGKVQGKTQSSKRKTVLDAVRAAERSLCGMGLCRTGDLIRHVCMSLCYEYPGDIADWPDRSLPDVVRVVERFAERAARPAGAPGKEGVTP